MLRRKADYVCIFLNPLSNANFRMTLADYLVKLAVSGIERVPGTHTPPCVHVCFCTLLRDFGSSRVSGESVKSMTDGSLEKKKR